MSYKISNNICFLLKSTSKSPLIIYDVVDEKINKYNIFFSKYNESIKKYVDSFSSYDKKEIFDIYNQLDKIKILNNYFNLNERNAFIIRENYIDNRYLFYVLNIDGKIICENIDVCQEKTDFLIYNIYNVIIRENKINSNKYYLILIINLFKILKKNGIFLFSLNEYFTNITIELIYILSNLFKKVYLIKDFPLIIVCFDFLSGDSLLTIDDIKECINYEKFKIYPKNNLDKFLLFITNNMNSSIKTNKLFFKGDIQKYTNNKILDLYGILSKDNDKQLSIFFNINTILKYSSFVFNDKIIQITNYFFYQDFLFIKYILENINLNKCLEIGMTNIVVLLTIILVKYNKKCNNHIKIIISNDNDKNNLKSTFYPLILLKNIRFISKSYQLIYNDYLKELQHQIDKKINYYDFIYIDGYDNNILKNNVIFIYASLLLKKDGIIIISNKTNDNIIKYNLEYFLNNPSFSEITTSQNILCYKKII